MDLTNLLWAWTKHSGPAPRLCLHTNPTADVGLAWGDSNIINKCGPVLLAPPPT